jgi:hypothetical protein
VDIHSVSTKNLVNSILTYSFNEPSCINPIYLDHTTFIDTATSVMLLTKKTLAATTPNTNKQISIIQPGGDCMTTTHAINLLLRKLPCDAHVAHQLSGLVNNLLSVAILCNAGCKVFFHKTGCKVTLNG